MNKRLVLKVLGAIMLVEAFAMLPSMVIGLVHHDPNDATALLF